MAILNFNKKFVEAIRHRTKRQTIRAFRIYPISEGDTLYLYTGLRTKKAEKLGEEQCTRVRLIRIMNVGIDIRGRVANDLIARIRKPDALDQFARSDGFADWSEMKTWWLKTHGLPFTGTLICW